MSQIINNRDHGMKISFMDLISRFRYHLCDIVDTDVINQNLYEKVYGPDGITFGWILPMEHRELQRDLIYWTSTYFWGFLIEYKGQLGESFKFVFNQNSQIIISIEEDLEANCAYIDDVPYNRFIQVCFKNDDKTTILKDFDKNAILEFLKASNVPLRN